MKRAGQTMLLTFALVAGSSTMAAAAHASTDTSARTAASCSSSGEKVTNGGFSRGAPDIQFNTWASNHLQFRTGNGFTHDGLVALSHEGSFLAVLGRSGPATTLSQDVTIPAGCRANLSLWLWINSLNPPSSTNTVFDTLTIKLGDTVLRSFTNLDPSTTSTDRGPSSYVKRTFDVSSFAGRTVNLSFTANVAQPSRPTFFEIDDVSLQTS